MSKPQNVKSSYVFSASCDVKMSSIPTGHVTYFYGESQHHHIASCHDMPCHAMSNVSINVSIFRFDKGLTLEMLALEHSLQWPMYIINPFDKAKSSCYTPQLTWHHSFCRNLPPIFNVSTCHVTLCHVKSCRIMSCHTVSLQATSHHITPYQPLPASLHIRLTVHSACHPVVQFAW